MDQRDPNTISGLLKLHLREYPFLSSKSVIALDQVLQDRNRVRFGLICSIDRSCIYTNCVSTY